MVQAEMSMCMIVKNEAKSLEKCLQSIRPYVKEICIVDTGSDDGTLEIVKKYADKYEIFTECNDSEGIFNFSMARNRSFELASYDITAWCDGDDEIIGAENFHKYVDKYKTIKDPYFIQFPYHYSFDQNGSCNLVHYRERLFFRDKAFQFVNFVHEVKIMKPGVTNVGAEIGEDIIWRHNRQFVNKTIAPNRNLRILKKWYEQNGDTDARQLYYLGLELGNSGEIEESKKMLTRYLELSGWDDEKFMAILRLIDYSFYGNNHMEAINYALDGIKIFPEWGEAYFACAKAYYFLAMSGKDEQKNWNKCINFAKIGLSLPPTRTMLFVNPNERNVEIYRYLNLALNKTGRIEEALNACNIGLQSDPNQGELLTNKKVYEDYLKRDRIVQAVEVLHRDGGIADHQKEAIYKILVSNVINAPVEKIEFVPEKIEEEKKMSDDKEMATDGLKWKSYHRPANYPREYTAEDQPVAVISPNSQAWGIPEGNFIYEDLPLKMTDAQLQSVVGLIWKEFMLGDELLSAIKFLENAPCRVRDSVETDNLLKKTKKMIAWIDDPELYDQDNTPIDINTKKPLSGEMIPLHDPMPSQGEHRIRWMTDRLPNKDISLCDWGSIDGEFSNRLSLWGYKEVFGIDCCTHSVKMATKIAKENDLNATYIQSYFKDAPEKLNGKKFDVCLSMDVAEHLIDPVEDLFKPAREVVKEDGMMLVGVPYKAWFQNEIKTYAHPWLYGRLDGRAWNDDTINRAHIRAPSVWSMAEYARKAGWYVDTSVYVQQAAQDVYGQGNVNMKLLPNPPISKYEKKRVVFFMGDGLEVVSPYSIDLNPPGGSEIALREMSQRFAALGHDVRVYAGCGSFGEGIYNGVEWRETGKFNNIECDILISSRHADALDDKYNVKSKLKVVWCHDLWAKSMSEEYAEKADIFFALSNWHKQFMLDRFTYLKAEKVVVTGNGLDFDRYDRQLNTKRNPHKMIVSSSPDRHLASLIKIFPKVKEKIPDAELTICYGFYNWKKSAQLSGDQNQLRLIAELEGEIEKLKPMGVRMLGRINQFDLAREFLSAGVWTLPSWFAETNCISFSEAISGGCAVVASNNAALGERILPELGAKIDGDWLSPKYIEEFADAVVSAMKGTTDAQRESNVKYARENLSWDKFANDWNKLFAERLDKTEGKAYIPYVLENFKFEKFVPKVEKEFKLKPYQPLIERK